MELLHASGPYTLNVTGTDRCFSSEKLKCWLWAGDGVTDLSIFRSDTTRYVPNSSANTTYTARTFGSTDTFFNYGDYDGDRKQILLYFVHLQLPERLISMFSVARIAHYKGADWEQPRYSRSCWLRWWWKTDFAYFRIQARVIGLS